MTSEFSRPERLDAIGEGERSVDVEADPAERARLARRFGLVSIERLAASYRVRKTTAGVAAEGQVTAQVTQACSITGEPIVAAVDETVSLLFAQDGAPAEEVELDADALDVLPIEDGAVDLGEAAAETMALALDPFPRGPNAAAALREAGVLSEDEVRPITGLAGLGQLFAGKSTAGD
ncbi:MAG: YceD family protein [Janthinobacterium lividum]